MKFETANSILTRLKEGQNVFRKEDPESIAFLKKMELVEVDRNRILLTKKGNFAAGMGIEDYLECNRTEKEILSFSLEKSRRKNRFLIMAFIFLFTLFIAALFTNLSFLKLF